MEGNLHDAYIFIPKPALCASDAAAMNNWDAPYKVMHNTLREGCDRYGVAPD